MLTEEMRILAGLQESVIKEDPLIKFIRDEENEIKRKNKRIKNEKKTVITHFNIFKEKMLQYQEMINNVNSILEEKENNEFINGLFKNKYPHLLKFADIIINESLGNSMNYLDKHYDKIKQEINKIKFLIDEYVEKNLESYFVSKELSSGDSEHQIIFNIYKNKDLTEKVLNKIEYGAQILPIDNNFSILKNNGKRYYIDLSKENVKELEKKGFLI